MIIILIIAVCTVGFFMIFSENINGRMIHYEKDEGFFTDFAEEGFYFDAEFYMNMNRETIDEIWKHKENYAGYLIEIDIQNITDHVIYDVRAQLSKKYNNLWFDSASIAESPLNLAGKERYYPHNIIVILKTDNMTSDEIDQLIKGIGITISARNYEWLPIYASKTIYFEE